MRYLIYTTSDKDKTTAAWVNVPKGWSSEAYGELQQRFAAKYGGDWATMVMLSNWNQTSEGILFDWELAGPVGASFQVFFFPHNTYEQVVQARHELRRKRDVVRMETIRIHKLVEFPLEDADVDRTLPTGIA